MVYIFDLHGRIEPVHFQKAFQALIDRSDALRTVFQDVWNEPRQLILPELVYELEFLDWSDEGFSEDKLKNWTERRSRKVLDLQTCTFDSVLIKISAERFVWYFNEHHLTTDARSSSLLFKKMAELYAASVSGETDDVPPFPVYQNYIVYEEKVRSDPGRAALTDYWRAKADSLPDPPGLYGEDNLRAETRSERIVIDLGKERVQALRNLIKEADLRAFTPDLSLFNIFATVIFAYLHRISGGQSNLSFGTPVHNRLSPEFKATPGLFIEFFPFAAEVRSNESFSELFKRVSADAFEFLRNAQPGASTPATNRSFNVILNYINTDFPAFGEIPCRRATWLHPGHADAAHHLRLHVYNDQEADSIELYFDLNRGVFNKAQLKTVPKHFLKLLDGFIKDRWQKIGRPSLLSKSEFQDLVIDLNKISEPEEKNVLELFQRQVAQNAEASAVIDKTEKFSFADLERSSNKLANHLIARGITQGDRIALYVNRSADLLVGILGTLKAGGVYVPIAANNPPERVAEKIRISESAVVLTHRRLVENLPDLQIPFLRLDDDREKIEEQNAADPRRKINPEDLAYIMFTSGSTGMPKGVKISHRALANYVSAAGKKYVQIPRPVFPLFTTIDFDLTVTSIFVPLTSGGTIEIYGENGAGAPDLAVLDVFEDNRADVIKLTPSHLSLIKERDLLSRSKIGIMIVGGEDFKTDLAASISRSCHNDLTIYNEYGPTEATVGCILHRFDPEKDTSRSVPVGRPFANAKAYILDEDQNPVPSGVIGKLYLAGAGLADGYWKMAELSAQKFVPNPFEPETKMYDTGDLARLDKRGEIEYLGRTDEQLKIGGIRVEPGEIETALGKHSGIESCVVELLESKDRQTAREIFNCRHCGLPSNYPSAEFDEEGICNFCLSFESYRQKVQKYFKTPADLQKIFAAAKTERKGEYDCLMLLSGGKDSTYALAQLVEMDLKVLAFTLDNGYISEQAKENIKRVCADLGVGHIFGTTPAMNRIFVDSLERHKNVCNGCFKTIYTLAVRIALEKNIPFIVTGLSRGQFFETRLTEELFWKEDIDTEGIDRMILDARKTYHRTKDAVKRYLDTSCFQDDAVFEKVRFIDFYRYFDVEFGEMMRYLDECLPWIRPTDTGRSTNCLINQVGIFVHKKELGYSNYAFPYSWDVRIGHKTREVSLDEINEEINEPEVKKIMREIGYRQNENKRAEKQLVAFYVAREEIPADELRRFLAARLPGYMIPAQFQRLESLPLTANGKTDRKALRQLKTAQTETETAYTPPENEIEEILAGIWSEVLQAEKIGRDDNFLELGGHSLAAIRIMTRANDAFDLELPLNKIFEMPTIASLAEYIEKTILALLEKTDA